MMGQRAHKTIAHFFETIPADVDRRAHGPGQAGRFHGRTGYRIELDLAPKAAAQIGRDDLDLLLFQVQGLGHIPPDARFELGRGPYLAAVRADDGQRSLGLHGGMFGHAAAILGPDGRAPLQEGGRITLPLDIHPAAAPDGDQVLQLFLLPQVPLVPFHLQGIAGRPGLEAATRPPRRQSHPR